MLERQPANRPAPGTEVVTDKGLSGEVTEAFFASPDLDLALIRRPAKTRRPSDTSRTGSGSGSRRSSGP
jgi:hypothetical protein